MIEYAAEDFEVADLATKGRFDVARRTDPSLARQWHVYGSRQGCFSDEEMAADGWVPVVESTEVMQNRQIDAEAHLDQIERLSKRASAAEDQIESQRLVIEELREENDRLERISQAPLRMRDLEVAWVAAEEADECREGDVLIIRDDEDNYLVRRMDDRSDLDSAARILSRAPRREPWADLADVLRAHTGEPEPDETAQTLYERGVRVTGGGRR